MMQQLRKSTPWVMVLVAIAFAGLMFFEWGMDITGQTSGSFGDIGRVNGAPVVYDEYMASYRNLYDQLQSAQEEPVTSVQNSELEDRAWDEAVNTILVEQELRRRGIEVTDAEILAAARFSPPPDVLSNPAFLTDGRFDPDKYQRFISTADPTVLLQLEAYYRDVIPRNKLARQIGSAIYVSDAELWSLYRDENERAAVRYVRLDPLTRVADDRVSVSEDEIERYYDDRREDEFFVPASAEIVSVSFSKTPTAADTAAVEERALELRRSILDGEDFAEIARAESDDEASAVAGGDLGVFAQGTMIPAFDSAVFAAPLNRTTAPVRTFEGLHLIEVVDRWGRDSAQARHILLRFERTDESEIALLAMADSLEELSESSTLGEAAAALGLETDTTELIETRPLIVGAGDVPEGGEWVFDEETQPGDASPVFETRTTFYAIELVSVDPSRYMTLDEATPAIRLTLGTRKKTAVALEEAGALAAEARAGRPLDELARENGLEAMDAGPFSRVDFVPGLGRSNAALGTAFGLEVGEVSDAVEANRMAFVIERTGHEAADSAAWLEQLDDQRALAVAAIQQQRLAQWIDALRETADIVDRRDEVLNAPEEDLPALPMQVF